MSVTLTDERRRELENTRSPAIMARPLALANITESQAIEVLGNSLYPGAKPESVAMVLSYCRANGYDPMKKPVHIVPMSVKVGANYEWRDVIMPGIAQYRIDASRTGDYAGKTEPEFGPDVTQTLGGKQVTYPQWCRVTVFRIVAGAKCAFTAKEYWLENYATAKKDTDAPNTMWAKRSYGQLAKCAEAQALRMAFPEQTGGTNTSDEMEGKTFDGVTIDQPRRVALPPEVAADSIPSLDEPPAPPTKGDIEAQAIAKVQAHLDRAIDEEGVHSIKGSNMVVSLYAKGTDAGKDTLNRMFQQSLARFAEPVTVEG